MVTESLTTVFNARGTEPTITTDSDWIVLHARLADRLESDKQAWSTLILSVALDYVFSRKFERIARA